jgi:group II intron reverse transcriptase/maturase
VNPQSPPPERSVDAMTRAAAKSSHPARADDLWEQVFSRTNLSRALRRVESNAGAPGVDQMTTAELRSHLTTHWPVIRQRLDSGHYRPAPVRRVTIPKPAGGHRELGVPAVLDRFIQQALLQVLQPVFDPTFSEHSYGFRPKRSAHQAVTQARGYVQGGKTWVVDVDLDAFFDRVQHDVLMARVSRRVGDRRVKRLIGSYLRAGVMADGVRIRDDEGTPQGSPLSPLLANVLLDDLDRELEARGHSFVRYADDIRVYVGTQRAAQRVLDSITSFLEHRLKLRVNRAKSGVDRATRRGLLGFGLHHAGGGRIGIRVDRKAMVALKLRVKALTARNWRVSMPVRIAALNRFIRGWCGYFALARTPSVFRDLDSWLRRRLRQVRWKEWKRWTARRRNLVALGIPDRTAREWAASRKGTWRVAGSAVLSRALPNSYWTDLGLLTFTAAVTRRWDV